MSPPSPEEEPCTEGLALSLPNAISLTPFSPQAHRSQAARTQQLRDCCSLASAGDLGKHGLLAAVGGLPFLSQGCPGEQIWTLPERPAGHRPHACRLPTGCHTPPTPASLFNNRTVGKAGGLQPPEPGPPSSCLPQRIGRPGIVAPTLWFLPP